MTKARFYIKDKVHAGSLGYRVHIIEGMNENIKGMREEMWEGFDKLPARIAKELKNFLSEERTFTKKG